MIYTWPIAIESRNEDDLAILSGSDQFIDAYEHEVYFEWRNEDDIACLNGEDQFVDTYEHVITPEWRNEDVIAPLDGLLEEVANDGASAPEPGSDPYVIETELDPAPGDTEVPITLPLYIPVGDRISTIEVDTTYIPARSPVTDSPSVIGINPLLTTIMVQYGVAGTPFVVFANGLPQSGWSATVDTNDYAGENRGIAGVGRNYTLTPGTSLPAGELVTVYVELVDYANNDHSYSYSFTTNLASASRIKELLVIAKDMLMVTMTVDVVSNKYLSDIANYTITNLSGGADGEVLEVRPTYTKATATFFIHVRPLKEGQTYKLTIKHRSIYDRGGLPVDETSFIWAMHRTKVDSTLRSIANMYSKKVGSILRSLIEAVMISDEKIGGDF